MAYPFRFRRLLTVCCIAGLVCFAGITRAADPVEIKLKPAAGDVQKMRVTMDQKIAQTIDGRAVEMTQTIGMGYTMATSEVSNGLATIKVTYDSVSFKHQSQMGTVEYDSTNPPAQLQPMAKGFAALAGQSFTMKITPAGKVMEVSGLDVMIDSIIKKLEIPQGPAKASVEKAIRSQFGEDSIKESMETMLAIYPEKPVNIGDTWNRKVSLTKGFPITMDNSYTLKDITNGVVTLDVKSKLTSNPDAPSMDMGQLKVNYNLVGEQTGTMKLSAATGWVQTADIAQKLGGDMKRDAGAGRIATWPITVETKMSVENK